MQRFKRFGTLIARNVKLQCAQEGIGIAFLLIIHSLFTIHPLPPLPTFISSHPPPPPTSLAQKAQPHPKTSHRLKKQKTQIKST